MQVSFIKTASFLSILFLITLTGSSAYANNQCDNLVGTWENQLLDSEGKGSVLTISDCDNKTGVIKGSYKSSTGTAGKTYNLVGFVNQSTKTDGKMDKATAISFQVRWDDYGSITSWSGVYSSGKNGLEIKTMWHLVRSLSNYEWDHIITGNDSFKKVK